ncbi:hypothetical protein [Halovenus halobia]|uniref:hypothetical protein n=1 Tax=Halovenus halobia TaxID=3396622 RepID=UPI003F577527
MTEQPLATKVAQYAGGGLVVFGLVGIGLLELVAGAANPVTAEGVAVQEALVPLKIRAYIILAGILIWGLYAVYRITASRMETVGEQRRQVDTGQPNHVDD